jgi:hypothetical protein
MMRYALHFFKVHRKNPGKIKIKAFRENFSIEQLASIQITQCFGSGSAFDWLPGSRSAFGVRIRIQEV